MTNVYDDGLVIDQKVKDYMGDHPGTSYGQALRGLLREEEGAEQEARAEFARRVPVYQREFRKSYADAAELVAKHDAEMVMPYAEATDLPVSIGDVMAAAKRAAGVAKVPLQVAVRRILEGQRDTAQKIAGDWIDHQTLVQINNLNLGSSIDQAYSIALRIVVRTYPEVDQMWQTGRVSELAMRTIFRQWFKD